MGWQRSPYCQWSAEHRVITVSAYHSARYGKKLSIDGRVAKFKYYKYLPPEDSKNTHIQESRNTFMPIPSFNSDGVLPPFIGRKGPPEWLSPYPTSAVEVVMVLGTTETRRGMIRGWLEHRAALRALGFGQGFQWLVGSFVEDREPKDLDTVTFLSRPSKFDDGKEVSDFMRNNSQTFDRDRVKATYNVDFMSIDLGGTPEELVKDVGYWINLFSHRRNDHVWKGLLQIDLDDEAEDKAALAMIGAATDDPRANDASPGVLDHPSK